MPPEQSVAAQEIGIVGRGRMGENLALQATERDIPAGTAVSSTRSFRGSTRATSSSTAENSHCGESLRDQKL
jgi:hypothetical protein